MIPYNKVLYESQNDGKLRFMKPITVMGPWRPVPPHEQDALFEREHSRQDAYNAFVGSLRGKTVVLFGAGPMMSRFNKDLLGWILDQPNIVVAGVNSLPGIAKNIWGMDPDELFEVIFAADAVAARAGPQCVYDEWGWEHLHQTPVFSKYQQYDGRHFPIRSASTPTLLLPDLYWRDSIAGAINLLTIMMSEPSVPKMCGGPCSDWPLVQARVGTALGRIILVGVEYNRYDHVYTHNEDFANLTEHPSKPWTRMDARHEGHDTIARFTREMGIKVYNSAPWSLIKTYEFCDFEDILQVPEELRTGVTKLGEPGHVPEETA